MSAGPVASVVVATRNRATLLPGLVSSLLAQRDVPSYEIILVNDASTDNTADVLHALSGQSDRIRVRHLGAHGGPATARNLGWQASRGTVIAFTDDDCLPSARWLAELIRAHGQADLVQGRTVTDIDCYGERGTFSRSVEVPRFSHLFQTCNMSYRRELLETVHGFDEAFGTSRGGAPNGEDADLGWRARERGARMCFAAAAVVVHPVATGSLWELLSSRPRSYRMVYFVKRHPGYRRYLHRRYFFAEGHPYALCSVLAWLPFALWPGPSTVALGLLGALPYARYRGVVRPLPGRRRRLPLMVTGAWLVDVADIAVLAAGSIRFRCLLL